MLIYCRKLNLFWFFSTKKSNQINLHGTVMSALCGNSQTANLSFIMAHGPIEKYREELCRLRQQNFCRCWEEVLTIIFPKKFLIICARNRRKLYTPFAGAGRKLWHVCSPSNLNFCCKISTKEKFWGYFLPVAKLLARQPSVGVP